MPKPFSGNVSEYNNVNGEVLNSTRQTVVSIKLKFNVEGGDLTLDLTPAFPEFISAYKVNYDATVDYGDGTTDKINTSNTSHRYDSAGEKTVQISGICQGLGTLPSSLTEVVELSGVSLFQKTFLYCDQLTSIPGSILNYAKLQDNFDYLFQGTSLTSIPEELFNECTQVKRLKGTFAETNITEIPARLFRNLRGLINLTSCFDSCSNLESIPEGLFANNPILSNVEGIFQGTRISSIDNYIFNNTRVTNFERALSVDLSNISSGGDGGDEEGGDAGGAIEIAQNAKDAIDRHLNDKNNPHKVKLEQLGIENLPLTNDVTMTGSWTINPGGSTNSAASLTLEMGYNASWKGTITWKSKSGYKDPERATGLITNVGSSGVAQSVTIPAKSSNYTGTITFYAKRTGLTVSGSNVVIASGQEDSRSYSRSVSFQKRYYFGYSLDDTLNEAGIKALETQALSTTRARSFSAQTSGLEYVYYVYPTSWGAVSQIYVGGYGALEAFNRSTITISPVSGYNETLYVYRSSLPGMYENSLTIQFT